ncbi:hypothetical protein HMPREF3039_00824 [Akkermansia sp. KLE1798]|nr:hypothetical protein HMPREF3039_00824 [Akkermansia sp. KLE1798]KZA04426.1 hypothetical protein HMPREF1326_01937 [Akkermansia sp. KLE1605]
MPHSATEQHAGAETFRPGILNQKNGASGYPTGNASEPATPSR